MSVVSRDLSYGFRDEYSFHLRVLAIRKVLSVDKMFVTHVAPKLKLAPLQLVYSGSWCVFSPRRR